MACAVRVVAFVLLPRCGGSRRGARGSTGGAGLRTLETGEATSLTCSVLYFEGSSQSLRAFDRITVEGLGNATARIQRHIVPLPPDDDELGP